MSHSDNLQPRAWYLECQGLDLKLLLVVVAAVLGLETAAGHGSWQYCKGSVSTTFIHLSAIWARPGIDQTCVLLPLCYGVCAANCVLVTAGLCLYRQDGLWTYEVCHKKHVRQFRQVRRHLPALVVMPLLEIPEGPAVCCWGCRLWGLFFAV
jgi:hypothetical protein